ncbi:MAG: hypothetical protein ACW986_09565 [Promethearchaeota archaeon]
MSRFISGKTSLNERVTQKKEDIIKGVEILEEYAEYELSYKKEIDTKLAKLEAKINSVKSEKDNSSP